MITNNEYLVCVRCFTFNQAQYIEDTLNGFTMQQTTFPFVCTIVDDASTDGEANVIRQYLSDHFDLNDKTIVRNVETEDYVMTFARHKINKNCYFAVHYLKYNHNSIKKSKMQYIAEWQDNAKYIALCEGDDYWIHPIKMQKQVSFLEEHDDYGLVYSNFKVRYGNDLVNSKTRGYTDFSHIVTESVIGTQTTCFRSDLYKDYSRDIPSSDRKGWLLGDAPLWIYFSYRAKVHFVDESLAVYRELSESASHSTDVEKAVRFIDNSYEVRKYMVIKLVQSEKIRNFLLKNLLNRRNVLSKVRLCSHRGYAKRAFDIYKQNWKKLTCKTNLMCCIYMLYGLVKPSKH